MFPSPFDDTFHFHFQVTAGSTRLLWNWELDEQYYTNWTTLCATLSEHGIRMMTYINPFLANNVPEFNVGCITLVSSHHAAQPHYRRNLFQEAASQGFLVKV